MFVRLKDYKPKKDSKYLKIKDDLVINAINSDDRREMIVSAFKNNIFPFYSGNYYEEFKEESESEDEKSEDDDTFEQITELDKFYGSDLINNYFKEKSLREIINKLKDYRKKPETNQKYNNLMAHLIIGL